MQLKVTATPVAVEDFEFNTLDGKTIKGVKITFKESANEQLFSMNTADKDFVALCKDNMFKEMKEIPFDLVKTGNFFKLKFVK